MYKNLYDFTLNFLGSFDCWSHIPISLSPEKLKVVHNWLTLYRPLCVLRKHAFWPRGC